MAKQPFNLSLDPHVITEVDLRAKALDLNRSQFVAMIIRRELARKEVERDVTRANGGADNLPKAPKEDEAEPALLEVGK